MDVQWMLERRRFAEADRRLGEHLERMREAMRNTVNQNVVTTAIAVLFEKQKPKKTLKPGAFSFRGTVEVELDAQISKAFDGTCRPAVKLPLVTILGICLVRAGVHRERIGTLIEEATAEALCLTKVRSKEEETSLVLTAAAVAAAAKAQPALPEESREGNTIVTGTATIARILKL